MEETKESVIEAALESACKKRNWMCPKTASPGQSGFPDRIVITDEGVVVFVEVKRPNKKPRKLQLRNFLIPLRRHNANVVVVSTEEQVDMLMDQMERHVSPEPENETSFYIKEK